MLDGKLKTIRDSIDYLQKEAVNKAQGFNYVSSSQVLGVVREKMKELGVLLETRITSVVFHHKDNNDRASKQHLVELFLEYTWVDVENGERKAFSFYSQGCDQHEKSVGKALTYGEKFFLLKQFNIPTDKDDPDAYAEKSTKSERKEDTDVPEVPPFTPETVADGLKAIGNKKVTIAGKQVKLGDKYKDFVVAATKEKKRIGTIMYYKLLADVGNVEKSLHINDIATMSAVISALKEVGDDTGQEEIQF